MTAVRLMSRRNLIIGGVALILLAVGMVLVSVRTASESIGSVPPPAEDGMRLTIPDLKRVKNVPVYTTSPDDEAKLGAGAVHVSDTGFPWESGSNVYIAGHRLGYPNTKSFLVFYDLNKLERGDKVTLKDAEGRRYVYKVFEEFIADPNDLHVMDPVPGKSVVSLQTCTLPNYAQRLIVRAELVKIKEPEVQADTGRRG